MLLQRLKEYQSRASASSHEETLPSEYSSQPIPWLIVISTSDNRASIIRTSGGTAKRDTGKRFNVPYLRRSGTNIKPQLLADKAEIALGVVAEDVARAQKRHADFLALVEACAQATNDPRVRAVTTFLQELSKQPLQLPADLQPNDFVTFEVDGVRLVELSTVQQFWSTVAPRLGQKGLSQLTSDIVLSWLSEADAGFVSQCIVCGEDKFIARVHPVAIKMPRSVSDQQLSIVTANKEAFHSYGLEQSLVAPTCRDCAASYAKAINTLVRSEQHSLLVSGFIFIFWTREPSDFFLLSLIATPQPEEVRALFDSARSGRERAPVNENAFYALSLSASGARVVVRDWIDTTVEAVQANLRRWFARQRIVGAFGEEPRPLGLFPLAVATVREAKDIVPTTPRVLLRSALTGGPLPSGLLYEAVRRNRAEQKVTPQRAALIKLVLCSQQSQEQEDRMTQLDPRNTNAAYCCGRLLAVLEDVQRAAIPGAKATIVDRFFGTASSAPASVFGRLLRGAQPHLAKLERDNPNAYRALQRRMEEVTANLDGFPRTLSLEDQALFSLGYYHQRAHDRAEAKAASERRKANETATDAAAL